MTEGVPSVLEQLNTVKVIVLLEREPLTDKFDQMMLTPWQYFRVLELVKSFQPKCNANSAHTHCVVEQRFRVHIKDIPSAYSDDEVRAASAKLEH